MVNRSNRIWQSSLKTRWFRGFITGLSFVLLIGLLNSAAIAQTSINQGRIAEILDGSQVYIQQSQARLNDVASRGQQVSTGNSRAQVSFNTGAVARLSTNSVLTIGQCANLQRGVLLVNGAVNGCTSSVTAGVRGTTYIMEVDDEGEERIQVLEGEVVVSPVNSDSSEASTLVSPSESASEESASEESSASPSDISDRPGLPGLPQNNPDAETSTSDEPIVLTAGQKIATRRGERLGAVENLSADDFIHILTGVLFDGFAEELPGMSHIREAFQELFPNVPFPAGGAPDLPVHRPRVPHF